MFELQLFAHQLFAPQLFATQQLAPQTRHLKRTLCILYRASFKLFQEYSQKSQGATLVLLEQVQVDKTRTGPKLIKFHLSSRLV